jgi:hypothetical protein
MDWLQWGKEITGLLSALLTPVVAVVAVLIAIFQYRLESLKWRLALFDKRYPVYERTMDYISFVVREARMTNERLFQFLRESKDKEFLFGNEVHSFLAELYKKGVDLRTRPLVYQRMPDGDARTAEITREGETLKWFGDQFETAKRIFEPYLSITRKWGKIVVGEWNIRDKKPSLW